MIHLCGATENAGVENAAPSKMQRLKMRDWKRRHQMTWVENAAGLLLSSGVLDFGGDSRKGRGIFFWGGVRKVSECPL